MGTRSIKEVEDNMGVLDWALSAMELEEIDHVFQQYGVDTTPNIIIDPDE